MNFNLSKIEKKNILKDYKQLTTQLKLDIEVYKEDEDWVPGYGEEESTSDWVEYFDVKCTPKEISNLNLGRYEFGDVNEGDLVLLFPPDTKLPKENKYKVNYKGREYVSETGLEPYQPMEDFLLFYVIVFRR